MFTTLEIIDDVEYIFCPRRFDEEINKYVTNVKARNASKYTTEMLLQEIAGKCQKGYETVRTWKKPNAKHGPSDLDSVKMIASVLEINYKCLLCKKEIQKEESRMTNIVPNRIITFDVSSERNLIISVYQEIMKYVDYVAKTGGDYIPETPEVENPEKIMEYHLNWLASIANKIDESALYMSRKAWLKLRGVIKEFQDNLDGGMEPARWRRICPECHDFAGGSIISESINSWCKTEYMEKIYRMWCWEMSKYYESFAPGYYINIDEMYLVPKDKREEIWLEMDVNSRNKFKMNIIESKQYEINRLLKETDIDENNLTNHEKELLGKIQSLESKLDDIDNSEYKENRIQKMKADLQALVEDEDYYPTHCAFGDGSPEAVYRWFMTELVSGIFREDFPEYFEYEEVSR